MILTPYTPTCSLTSIPKNHTHLLQWYATPLFQLYVFQNFQPRFSLFIIWTQPNPCVIFQLYYAKHTPTSTPVLQYKFPASASMNIITHSHHKFCTGPAPLLGKFLYTGILTPTFIISIEVYSHQHSHHKFCTGPASLPGKFLYTGILSTTIIISIDVYSTTVHI